MTKLDARETDHSHSSSLEQWDHTHSSSLEQWVKFVPAGMATHTLQGHLDLLSHWEKCFQPLAANKNKPKILERSWLILILCNFIVINQLFRVKLVNYPILKLVTCCKG